MCALHTEHGAATKGDKGSQAKVLKDTVATLAAVVAGVASASLIWIGPWAHETCALAEVIIFFGLSLRTVDFLDPFTILKSKSITLFGRLFLHHHKVLNKFPTKPCRETPNECDFAVL